MSKKLEGKIALITGGSRDIGAAIAKRTRLPPSDRNLNSRPAESENRWRQNQGEPK